jgi:uncharacterized protein YlxW (UPF0749 family)
MFKWLIPIALIAAGFYFWQTQQNLKTQTNIHNQEKQLLAKLIESRRNREKFLSSSIQNIFTGKTVEDLKKDLAQLSSNQLVDNNDLAAYEQVDTRLSSRISSELAQLKSQLQPSIREKFIQNLDQYDRTVQLHHSSYSKFIRESKLTK